MNKIALITGATAGIGEATAYKFAELQYNLILTGRRKDRLESIKKNILEKFHVEVYLLHFDIRILKEVNKQIEGLPEEWKQIDILVNNAGLAAGLSDIQNGDIDDWERMIDTNMKGLLYITRKVSPIMIKNKKGHIFNITSIAGKEVYPKGNVYCATKHAADALTKGMRIDLLEHGIKVTSIAPGMVDTEFSLVRFNGDKEKADSVYNGLTPLYAEDIADAIIYAATRPAHVNINDMLIMPTIQASATNVKRD
jgi:3-hydroxy acid dehydrogenase / malonic semialdehyde reductase